MKKFKLTANTIHHDGVTLHQIKCITNIPEHNIKVGDLGGYVQALDNLDGNAWVFHTAKVYGNSLVNGSAQVSGNARVFDRARVSGNAQVSDNTKVYGSATVSDSVRVYGNASIFDSANVCGDALIYNCAKIYGSTQISGNAKVYGDAEVYGSAHVLEDSQIFGDSRVFGGVVIDSDTQIYGGARIFNKIVDETNPVPLNSKDLSTSTEEINPVVPFSLDEKKIFFGETLLMKANESFDYKQVLKKIFPEIFVNDKSIDLTLNGCSLNESLRDSKGITPTVGISIRSIGNLAKASFYLSNKYNWEIKEDNRGELCLIPTMKK